MVGRGYEVNKLSIDHVGFNGIAHSSVSTSSGVLCELPEAYRRESNPVRRLWTLRRVRVVRDMMCRRSSNTRFGPRPVGGERTHSHSESLPFIFSRKTK